MKRMDIIFEDDSMESDETKRNIDKYRDEVKKLNSAIKEIQNGCSHEEYSIKNISTSTAIIRRVCKSCDAVIGYPSNEELKDSGYM